MIGITASRQSKMISTTSAGNGSRVVIPLAGSREAATRGEWAGDERNLGMILGRLRELAWNVQVHIHQISRTNIAVK